MRAQEISRYVEHGFFDCGLTGRATGSVENNSGRGHGLRTDVYSRASNAAKPVGAGCAGGLLDFGPARISRAKTYCHGARAHDVGVLAVKHGVKAEVEFSWGATEVKVPDSGGCGLCDLIWRQARPCAPINWRIVDTILETTTHCMANKTSWGQPGQAREDRGRLRCFSQGAAQCRRAR